MLRYAIAYGALPWAGMAQAVSLEEARFPAAKNLASIAMNSPLPSVKRAGGLAALEGHDDPKQLLMDPLTLAVALLIDD